MRREEHITVTLERPGSKLHVVITRWAGSSGFVLRLVEGVGDEATTIQFNEVQWAELLHVLREEKIPLSIGKVPS